MVVIVTGNIGSGKSTILKILENNGYKIIDADKISREVFENKIDLVKEKFGTTDRKKLREIIFNDKKKKEELEKIIIPDMLKILQKEINRAENENYDLIIEASTYYEQNLNTILKYPVILAYAPKEICIQRAMKRDNSPREIIETIYDCQIPIDEKKFLADCVIDTRKDLKDIESKLKLNLFTLKLIYWR
jgi:dephospho-CoA kinase